MRLEPSLPDMNRFIDNRGQMRMASFLAYVAFRPQYWRSLIAAWQEQCARGEGACET